MMRRSKQKHLSTLFIKIMMGAGILLTTVAKAQDIHFSQFESSPLNLNPSLTGFFDGDYRFVANHRSQWRSVSEPYRTFSGSMDMVLNGLADSKSRYNTGLLFNHDRAGDSKLSLTQLALSFSVLRPLDNEAKHFISLGLQAGYVSRSINYSGLTYDEQYNGDAFDPSAGNTENFENDKHGYADIGAGFAYLFRTEKFKAGTGFSFQHINRPNDAFFDQTVKMFNRFQADLKFDFPILTRFDLVPALLYMSQGPFREITGGTSVRYRLSELPGRRYAFYLGGWIRSKDAAIASVGMDYNNLNVGFSYDINTSDLDRASNGKGGYEIALIYIIRKVKPVGIRPPCPLY